MSLALLLMGFLRAADLAAAAPATCDTASLRQAIARAPHTIAAVRALAHTFDRLRAGDPCNVQRFELYWRFYGEVQEAMALRVEAAGGAGSRCAKELAPLGWRYVESEAGAHVADGNDWLVRRVGVKLPAAYREYLTLRMRDVAEGFSEDAGLLITWQSLRERIRRWERFEARYPDFAYADIIKAQVETYLGALLTVCRASDLPIDDDVPRVSLHMCALSAPERMPFQERNPSDDH